MARKQINGMIKAIACGEDHPQIEGFYAGSEVVTIKGEERLIYHFVSRDGEGFQVWNNAALTRPMQQVVKGSFVELVYSGEQTNPKTGRTFKAIDVFVDDAIEPSGAVQEQIDLPF